MEGTEFEVLSPLIISSIGSLPESIPGVPLKHNLYQIENKETGALIGVEGVFALGNAVTGRGNIRDSRLHARKVVEWVVNNYLGDSVNLREPLSWQQIQQIFERVAHFQRRVGYEGDYEGWTRRRLPVRLEDLTSRQD